MHRDDYNLSELVKKLSLCIFSIVLLTGGFYSNSLNVAEQQWFVNSQRDSESFIVGRMLKSREDGILSAGGLTGVVIRDGIDSVLSQSPIQVQNNQDDYPFESQIQYQYIAYSNNLTFDGYSPYMSQIGGQGMFFSLLDHLIPISGKVKLKAFHMFTSILSAVALTLVILWFYGEFGFSVAIFVVMSAVLSQWLTVFGRNLWWSIWAFYLPMIAVMYFLKHNRAPENRYLLSLGALVFISVFIKFLVNGYEYIFTTLIMMMVPIVYYCMLDRMGIRRFFRDILIAVLGAFFAIFLGTIILCAQIAIVQENALAGVEHLLFSLAARTHGDAQNFPASYTAGLNASSVDIVIKYLKGTFFDLNNFLSSSYVMISRFIFKIRYVYLIVFFLGMSFIVLFRLKERDSVKERQNHVALIIAAWFSILAPLSCFIISKAHSFDHKHMNYIVWQMPFTLFGFAVFGLAARRVLPDFTRISRRLFFRGSAGNSSPG
jgi:hypothetical protein